MSKWQKFLKNILELLNIDKVLSKSEFKHALFSIENKDQLNQFLEIIAIRKKKADNPCPSCNTNIKEIMKTGQVGCDKCSHHFEEVLISILNKIQGKEILDLQMKMSKAVKEEKYEDAALLRDKIKKLSCESKC